MATIIEMTNNILNTTFMTSNPLMLITHRNTKFLSSVANIMQNQKIKADQQEY